MEAITAVLLFSFFLCAFFNSLFFPSSKLRPWLHSILLSAVSAFSAPPNPHPETPNTASDPKSGKRREYSSLGTVFSTFDSDGDGFISLAELSESLRRLGFPISGGEVRSLMEKADSNGDGLIDFGEFAELCSSWGTTQAETEDGGDAELREAFAVFDGNGDGKITVDELGLVLKSLGLKQGAGAEACRGMIEKVDMDGDGMVNFEEFKKMMAANEGNFF
ncbi:putative calcium-binding protein CML30 [Platanthera guangdongensis]|uniref:Calcium-binding protein CML30 n=1 Tax=Platanthera guangdongensis TaxID=2320717 RepID=A0ABR2M0K7_9ASPA